MSDAPDKTSRHFTVVVRRDIDRPPDALFAAWTDPAVRRAVIAPEGSDWHLVEADIRDGGVEVIQHRPADQPGTTVTRRYAALRPPRLIVAQSVSAIDTGPRSPHSVVAPQELLLFKPTAAGAELVASSQVVSVQPNHVRAVEDAWNRQFDRFEDELEPQPRETGR